VFSIIKKILFKLLLLIFLTEKLRNAVSPYSIKLSSPELTGKVTLALLLMLLLYLLEFLMLMMAIITNLIRAKPPIF